MGRYDIPEEIDGAPTLFDDLPGRVNEPQRRRYVKPAAFGCCPSCTASSVGLVVSPTGRHLMWKWHRKKVGSVWIECDAAGQLLCTLPSRHVPSLYNTTPHCPHPDED